MAGAIVIGAGPGIGTSVARRLAREGLAVTVLARSQGTVDAALAALAGAAVPALGVTADVTDEPALRAALDEAVARFGVPEVLVYNAALIQSDPLGELSAAQQLEAWAVNVVGAITAVAHLGPAMAQTGRGTILLTGGMPEPIPEVTSLSLGKASARTSPPASTWPPSRSRAPWRPARRSTPTRSPRSTGGCTRSPRGRGSARSSTPGPSPLSRRGSRTPRAEQQGRIASDPDRRRRDDLLGAGGSQEAIRASPRLLARGLQVSHHQGADRLVSDVRARATFAGERAHGAAQLLRLGRPDQEVAS